MAELSQVVYEAQRQLFQSSVKTVLIKDSQGVQKALYPIGSTNIVCTWDKTQPLILYTILVKGSDVPPVFPCKVSKVELIDANGKDLIAGSGDFAEFSFESATDMFTITVEVYIPKAVV